MGLAVKMGSFANAGIGDVMMKEFLRVYGDLGGWPMQATLCNGSPSKFGGE